MGKRSYRAGLEFQITTDRKGDRFFFAPIISQHEWVADALP